jgi:hypothetical protein
MASSSTALALLSFTRMGSARFIGVCPSFG